MVDRVVAVLNLCDLLENIYKSWLQTHFVLYQLKFHHVDKNNYFFYNPQENIPKEFYKICFPSQELFKQKVVLRICRNSQYNKLYYFFNF